MMRIPFELAETLAAVVDEGTLDAAARRLHITPSAVSQRIKTLEEQLGRVVLVRAKPARPTDAGSAVLRLARQLALLEHDAVAELGDAAGIASIPLAVNADSLATWFLPPLARASRRLGVVFDLYRDDQDYTAGLLESGTVMAAVTSRERAVAGCRAVPLGTMRYRATASPEFVSHWLPDGASAAALAVAPVVEFDRNDDLQTASAALTAGGRAAAPALRPGIRRLRACRPARSGLEAAPGRAGVRGAGRRLTGRARRRAGGGAAVLAAVEPALRAARCRRRRGRRRGAPRAGPLRHGAARHVAMRQVALSQLAPLEPRGGEPGGAWDSLSVRAPGRW
ncbi:ArgP/LysG family DNA-binding transcriptional regulator [Microbacterium elymi]|uniref:ArgP/LysG family DNA-binding transcriptional regulator n=1 Tax=Microbacterium elymi TaxID=2909587 RepID=UPI00338D9955